MADTLPCARNALFPEQGTPLSLPEERPLPCTAAQTVFARLHKQSLQGLANGLCMVAQMLFAWRYVTPLDKLDFNGLYDTHIRVRAKEIQTMEGDE